MALLSCTSSDLSKALEAMVSPKHLLPDLIQLLLAPRCYSKPMQSFDVVIDIIIVHDCAFVSSGLSLVAVWAKVSLK